MSNAWRWIAASPTRFFGVIAVVGVLVLGGTALKAALFPSEGDIALQEQTRQREANAQAAREAEDAARDARIEAIVACENALRGKYRLAVDVSVFNADYVERDVSAVVKGEDDLPDGRIVAFRCEFVDGTLTSSSLR